MFNDTNGAKPGANSPEKAKPPSLSTATGGFADQQQHGNFSKSAYFLGSIKAALIRLASWLAVIFRGVA